MIRSVLDFLENTAAVHGDKTAFSDESDSLSFNELKDLAQRIGTALLECVDRGEAVAVCMEKCPFSIAAFLGVRYAGGFYIPVDPTLPPSRIKDILNASNAKCVIAREDDNIPAEKFSGKKIFYLNDLKETDIDKEALADRRKHFIDTDPLYAIFTSGSTGVPKGVLISEHSVINLTYWFTETFEFNEKEVIANQAPFYFDASVKEIYAVIRSGATMRIVPRRLFSQPVKLISFLNDFKVSIIAWVPSVLCMIANFNTFKKIRPESLKKILFMGETMPTKQLNMWIRALPSDVMYANLYGPTESTVDCVYYIVNREFSDDEPIPIGNACNNTEVMLLREDGSLISEPGESGEICIKGRSLAIGYLNRPEETKAAFVYHDFGKGYTERVYHTGDIGRYNEYGEIVFGARKDYQIKHMGHRIELGDIEAYLTAVEGIERGCCLFDSDHDMIVAFYEGTAEKNDIVKELKDHIPDYMVPNDFRRSEKLPLNNNGKIDKVQLNKEINNA